MATIHPHPGPDGNAPSHGSSRAAVAIALLLIAAVVAFGYTIAHLEPATPPDLGDGAKLLPVPRPVEEFSLRDHTGARLDRSRLLGKWSLFFFGYTYCPDVCPITLQTLGRVEQHWAGREAGQIPAPQVIFVSVDPQRDSLERLSEYVAFFDPAFVGATGSEAQLQILARSVGVYYAKAATDSDAAEADGYLVDHSAQLYLIDPRARLRAVLDDPHDPVEFAELVSTIQSLGEEP